MYQVPFGACIQCDCLIILAILGQNSSGLESLLLAAAIFMQLQDCHSWDKYEQSSSYDFLLSDLSLAKKRISNWLQSLPKQPNFLQIKYLSLLSILCFFKFCHLLKLYFLYAIARSSVILITCLLINFALIKASIYYIFSIVLFPHFTMLIVVTSKLL